MIELIIICVLIVAVIIFLGIKIIRIRKNNQWLDKQYRIDEDFDCGDKRYK
jgi:hypothetical protein